MELSQRRGRMIPLHPCWSSWRHGACPRTRRRSLAYQGELKPSQSVADGTTRSTGWQTVPPWLVRLRFGCRRRGEGIEAHFRAELPIERRGEGQRFGRAIITGHHTLDRVIRRAWPRGES